MCKFKRCMVSVVALGMAAVMFSGCGDSREKAAPVFREVTEKVFLCRKLPQYIVCDI